MTDVSRGDTLEIQVPENPGTGYRWSVDALDENIVQLQDSAMLPAADSGVGGGGVRVFRFRVVGNGETTLRLKHWREWQGDSSVDDRFEARLRTHD